MSSESLYCSFCRKSQHEVKKLIAGPTVYICDECIELCADILHEEVADGPVADMTPQPQSYGDLETLLTAMKQKQHRELETLVSSARIVELSAKQCAELWGELLPLAYFVDPHAPHTMLAPLLAHPSLIPVSNSPPKPTNPYYARLGLTEKFTKSSIDVT